LRNGDENAYIALIEVYGESIYKIAFPFFYNREDAEDITQEVFIQISRNINRFRGQAKLSTWINRITFSICVDEIRKRKRRKRFFDSAKQIELETLAQMIAGENRADEGLQQSELLAYFHHHLNLLSDSLRIAYTLSKIEGFTPDQIAELLGSNRNAVNLSISKANKKINLAFKKYFENK
jgi:RNA polymerase sigma-70 factor (ECF subfamily)